MHSRQPILRVINAELITMAEGQSGAHTGWFTVDADGRIDRLEFGPPDPSVTADETFDAQGAFVAPGFVSAHSHLSTSGSRGLGMDASLYGWADYMTRYTRHCTEEDIYWIVLHGSLDFLSNGITTAYDFTDSRLPFYMAKDGTEAAYGTLRSDGYATEQVRAKVDAGIRFIDSIMIDDQVGSEEEIQARFDRTKRYSESLDHGGRYFGTAITGSVQWSSDRKTAEREVAIMRRFGVMNQPHFLETLQQIDFQRIKFDWYEEAGALGPDLVFGHFIHATPEMIRKAAHCGCGMSWQPTANGRLASGVANIPLCVEAGLRLGVGIDDQACTDISDPWQNMRIGIYTQRAVRSDPKAMGVEQMLRLHTMGSADVMGVADKVGSLEPGKFADFLVVDPRDPDTGPVWNAIGTYVLACGLRNLKYVFVAGKLVNEGGRSLNPLAARASEETHRRLRTIAETVRTDPSGLVAVETGEAITG